MINRRDFVKMVTGATAGVMGLDSVLAEQSQTKPISDRLGGLLPLRKLGQTGQKVTMLGVGGHHLGRLPESDAQEVIETALEGGIRFFDSAEIYQKGGSEKLLGKLLTPKYRDVVYLMTKTTATTTKQAREHLDASLKRLNTDYLDLWQIHQVMSPEDVDDRLAGGILEAVQEARQKGKVRHIGFTGHRQPNAHLRMLAKTNVLQTCQMPINVADPSYSSFIEKVLPLLLERKMAVLAMKTACAGKLFSKQVVPDQITLEQMHHFVWSLPVSVLIGGFDNVDQLRDKIRLARSFSKMTHKERADLIKQTAESAGKEMETYKA